MCGKNFIADYSEENKYIKMSSDGGDGDDIIYGYLPGSTEPYVSAAASKYQFDLIQCQ